MTISAWRPYPSKKQAPTDAVSAESAATLRLRAATLGRVRAVVLLGGTVRVSELGRGIGRSMLDLPARTGQTLLEAWCEQVAAFGRLAGIERCPLRVRISHDTPAPTPPANVPGGPGGAGVEVLVESDESAYRGSGGVLRDMAQQFADDDYLLTGSAAQVLLEPLTGVAVELADTGAPVSLVSHRDGTPGGLMLLRCGVLKQLPKVGFVDLKEQALPRIAREQEVRVIHRDVPTGLPVRTLTSYMTALRALHHQMDESVSLADPFMEDWKSSFAIVEPGAEVASTARVHDSVVLKGGRVGEGAVVVRAVVGPGGVVPANRTVVDSVVSANERHGKRGG
ncbi:MAG: hypothetical protein WD534_03690 [Phycisphaeraceae bacterium]